MNILIVKTSAIGDVLHTLPALHVLRSLYPDANISWLVEEAAADIISEHPSIDQIIISKRKHWLVNFQKGRWWSTCKEVILFIGSLRARHYDLLIDFQGLLKSSMLIACCRATRKVGFGRGMAHSEGSYLFLNERIPPVDMNMHAVDREVRLLEAIGMRLEKVKYVLPLSQKYHERAIYLLTKYGLSPDKGFVAINPMTTWRTKHWDNYGFAAVADLLLTLGMEVVFTGGQGDRVPIDSILILMKNGKRAVNLAGLTDLKTLAAIYTQSRLLITIDTGPMHIAAAVGTATVALFGPTAPWRTGPFGTQHLVLRADLACSPCLKKHCDRQHECMKAITVEQVMCAVEKIVNKKCDEREFDRF